MAAAQTIPRGPAVCRRAGMRGRDETTGASRDGEPGWCPSSLRRGAGCPLRSGWRALRPRAATDRFRTAGPGSVPGHCAPCASPERAGRCGSAPLPARLAIAKQQAGRPPRRDAGHFGHVIRNRLDEDQRRHTADVGPPAPAGSLHGSHGASPLREQTRYPAAARSGVAHRESPRCQHGPAPETVHGAVRAQHRQAEADALSYLRARSLSYSWCAPIQNHAPTRTAGRRWRSGSCA